MERRTVFGVLSGVALLVAGCASMFANGGKLVGAGEKQDVLVTYRAEGVVPAGVTYQLVRTAEGDAMFERSPDGSGAVITNRWTESGEDHFFMWVGGKHGYEYVVPADRSRPARKYVYPAGYFTVATDGAVKKPVPTVKLDPVAKLIPLK